MLEIKILGIRGQEFRSKSVLQISKVYLLASVKLAGIFPF